VEAVFANPPSGSADYRRQARRIRASFTGNSFLTQQALQALAKRRDDQMRYAPAAEVAAWRVAPAGGSQPGSSGYRRNGVADAPSSQVQLQISAVVERGFAEHAASKMQSFGFTFSDRIALLDTAETLGISRFRANLILAMQENRAPARAAAKQSALSTSFFPWFLLMVGIEILIVLAVVLIFTR